MKKKWFTLIELLISIVVFAIMFGTLISLFMRIIRLKTDIDARHILIQNTYDVMEKLNGRFQDYTIDYEEYFNRQMVGCNTANLAVGGWTVGSWFRWNVNSWATAPFVGGGSGTCDTRTAYGNRTAIVTNAANVYGTYISTWAHHQLYWCSKSNPGLFGIVEGIAWPRLIIWSSGTVGATSCPSQFLASYLPYNAFLVNGIPAYQPYGMYKMQFVDVKEDVDDAPGRAGDDDDTNNGIGPVAIAHHTWVQELYLISKDKKKRLFVRRKLVASRDFNNSASINADYEKQFALQILQLKAFDAGEAHNFTSTQSWVYNGVIDTWACDADAGFICTGSGLGSSVYSGYKLPANRDDGWVNITTNEFSIADWNFVITPVKDPEYSRWEQNFQTNPKVTVYLKSVIYGANRYNKIGSGQISRITYDLQSTFNIKTYY